MVEEHTTAVQAAGRRKRDLGMVSNGEMGMWTGDVTGGETERKCQYIDKRQTATSFERNSWKY
jgi:hypothetical protein